MKPIPKKLREEMSNDPFYYSCCITGKRWLEVKIEWHHNFIFAGKQVQEKWCILPVCKEIHDRVFKPEIKKQLTKIMLNRASEETLIKYSKVENLLAVRDRLNAQA